MNKGESTMEIKKSKSLKRLYEELLEYVNEKYANDNEVTEFVEKISSKKIEIANKKQARKMVKELPSALPKITAKFSVSTLDICNKLICVEKVHNSIMSIDNPILALAETEILKSLANKKIIEV